MRRTLATAILGQTDYCMYRSDCPTLEGVPLSWTFAAANTEILLRRDTIAVTRSGSTKGVLRGGAPVGIAVGLTV